MKESADFFQKTHIAGPIFVGLKSNYEAVSIRHYFMPVNQASEHPTKHGISLRLDEWECLLGKLSEAENSSEELKKAAPCYFDHHNQMDLVLCTECNPFQRDVNDYIF